MEAFDWVDGTPERWNALLDKGVGGGVEVPGVTLCEITSPEISCGDRRNR